MDRRLKKRIVGIAVIALLSLVSYTQHFFGSEKTFAPVVASALKSSDVWTAGGGRSAAENATHHFKKHGAEFGFTNKDDYVAAAIAFTTRPLADGVMTNTQKDGDTAFYNPKTAEYAVKSPAGKIRTYFKLNPKIHGYATNTDYFNAQAGVGRGGVANDNTKSAK